jgi:hypothetical protein
MQPVNKAKPIGSNWIAFQLFDSLEYRGGARWGNRMGAGIVSPAVEYSSFLLEIGCIDLPLQPRNDSPVIGSIG